jgi:hypothetical protein
MSSKSPSASFPRLPRSRDLGRCHRLKCQILKDTIGPRLTALEADRRRPCMRLVCRTVQRVSSPTCCHRGPVALYLAALPADRRAALSAVLKAIDENLPDGYEESMQFGMIGCTSRSPCIRQAMARIPKCRCHWLRSPRRSRACAAFPVD